jgi:hypothetical protein
MGVPAIRRVALLLLLFLCFAQKHVAVPAILANSWLIAQILRLANRRNFSTKLLFLMQFVACIQNVEWIAIRKDASKKVIDASSTPAATTVPSNFLLLALPHVIIVYAERTNGVPMANRSHYSWFSDRFLLIGGMLIWIKSIEQTN